MESLQAVYSVARKREAPPAQRFSSPYSASLRSLRGPLASNDGSHQTLITLSKPSFSKARLKQPGFLCSSGGWLKPSGPAAFHHRAAIRPAASRSGAGGRVLQRAFSSMHLRTLGIYEITSQLKDCSRSRNAHPLERWLRRRSRFLSKVAGAACISEGAVERGAAGAFYAAGGVREQSERGSAWALPALVYQRQDTQNERAYRLQSQNGQRGRYAQILFSSVTSHALTGCANQKVVLTNDNGSTVTATKFTKAVLNASPLVSSSINA